MTLAVRLDALAGTFRPRLREWRQGARRLRRSLLAMVGLGLIALYALMALLAPVLSPPETDDPYRMRLDFGNELRPPSAEHPFGTGPSGVDIFHGVVWGSRISIIMGLGVVAVAAALGILLGGIAGYFGGKLDELIMRITDVFLSMPLLILAMGVTVALGPGLFHIGLALALTWWPSYTRLVRAQVLSVRENAYVEAARALGASDARVLARHVLPNALSPVVVQATLDIGSVILVSAALSFIGFGPGGSGFAEWGTMVSRGGEYMTRAWWAVTIPGLAILGFALGFNLLGDGLRDVLDPRLRR